jgi:hypothetical protein
MAKLRTATIRYPLALSLSIRTYCILHGVTLSAFFQKAAQLLLDTKIPSGQKKLPRLSASGDAHTTSTCITGEKSHA